MRGLSFPCQEITRVLRRRTLTALLASAALAGGATTSMADTEADEVQRVAGGERISTAAAASEHGHGTAETVLLATADNFPDALASTALAAASDAPLLLTRSRELPGEVADEIERLEAGRVVVLGGHAAVPAEIDRQLRDLGVSVQRVFGADRFETAGEVAVETGPSPADEVVLALGSHPEPEQAWADAVAAGALAASDDRVPVLLVIHDGVPDPTEAALASLDPERVTVVGGEEAIGSAVVETVEELGYAVRRVGGATRYATSAQLATDALQRREGAGPAVVATGEDYPDALTAGPLAAAVDGTLVLTSPSELPAEGDEVIREHPDRWDGGLVVGGAKAASGLVVEQLAAALDGQPRPEPAPEEPLDDPEVVDTFEGEASWYGDGFDGQRTASGERYDPSKLTAAHRELPFGTRVRVTNTSNDESVVVRINDRGPFVEGRVLDLSRAAAEEIGLTATGVAPVFAEVLAD